MDEWEQIKAAAVQAARENAQKKAAEVCGEGRWSLFRRERCIYLPRSQILAISRSQKINLVLDLEERRGRKLREGRGRSFFFGGEEERERGYYSFSEEISTFFPKK